MSAAAVGTGGEPPAGRLHRRGRIDRLFALAWEGALTPARAAVFAAALRADPSAAHVLVTTYEQDLGPAVAEARITGPRG